MTVIIFFNTSLLRSFLKVCLEVTANYTLTNFFDIQMKVIVDIITTVIRK